MKNTFNVKNFCVKTSLQTIQKKTFNVQTAVHKRCWIEFVFRVILFIWFLQNENEKNNSTIQLLLYDFFESEITKWFIFSDEKHIQRFH